MRSVTCNLCGGDDWSVRFPATDQSDGRLEVAAFRCTHAGYGSHAQIVQCHICGFVYSNPRWEDGELLDAYSAVEDDRYVLERAGRERTFTKHLKALEKYTGAGNGRRLLDVGAYIGVFVEVAQTNGWDAIGIEPSHWAVEIANSRNIPVIEGTLGAGELEGEQFDAITLWDVIEHLDDPSAELGKIYTMLKPGGVLAVHTMDINSTTAKVMGSRWPWLMDMHIHYFGRKTLVKMLEKNGFEPVWIGAQSRFLSLGYIASRIAGISQPVGRSLSWLIGMLGVGEATIPINFGDLMTAFARRPK
ncbi:MAG: class I SAM-dependent methyltransferase [Candidatus Promineifilaceae bacterium]